MSWRFAEPKPIAFFCDSVNFMATPPRDHIQRRLPYERAVGWTICPDDLLPSSTLNRANSSNSITTISRLKPYLASFAVGASIRFPVLASCDEYGGICNSERDRRVVTPKNRPAGDEAPPLCRQHRIAAGGEVKLRLGGCFFLPNGSAFDRPLPQVLEAQQHGQHPFELAVEMDLITAELFQLVCVQRLAECLLADQGPVRQFLPQRLEP
jgi:hypothetical protein